MSNRTLVFLTALVIGGMLILFTFNISNILTGQPLPQVYLKYNDVRGMAIISQNQIAYTLNFKQQNTIIDILNLATPIEDIPPGERQPTRMDKLVIYQFQNKPDIVLTLLTYVNQNLVFSSPNWAPDGYLIESSNGRLKELISESHD